MTKIENIKEKLVRYGQEHLIKYWDELTDQQRNNLVDDINEINLEEVQSFFKRATSSLEESAKKLDDRMEPIPESTFMSTSRTNEEKLKVYENEGKRANYAIK